MRTELIQAREQHNNKPERHAAIRYLQMGQPKVLPSDFIFQDVPKARRTPFSEIRELVHKGRLYTGNDRVVLLVRKPAALPSSSRPRGRAARLPNNEPVRIGLGYKLLGVRKVATSSYHPNGNEWWRRTRQPHYGTRTRYSRTTCPTCRVSRIVAPSNRSKQRTHCADHERGAAEFMANFKATSPPPGRP